MASYISLINKIILKDSLVVLIFIFCLIYFLNYRARVIDDLNIVLLRVPILWPVWDILILGIGLLSIWKFKEFLNLVVFRFSTFFSYYIFIKLLMSITIILICSANISIIILKLFFSILILNFIFSSTNSSIITFIYQLITWQKLTSLLLVYYLKIFKIIA